jgi:CRISPR-associated protein Cas1
MKKLLNTLYVTSQGMYLSREGETVLVKQEKEVKMRVPIHTLESIVVLTSSSMSTPFMGFCAENGVTLSLLDERGRFFARVQGPVRGNVLLRREQYRAADDPERATRAAFAFVAAKIANCRGVLLRAAREKEELRAALEPVCDSLARSLDTLYARHASGQLTVDGVRGCEGDCASQYFGVFDRLIVGDREQFSFPGRSRRPPLDRVNTMLSFAYTLLVHDIVGALEAVGLDPYVGFLHTDRPGRPSLALDLMEELRPVIADRLVLSLINRRQVDGAGFVVQPNGAVEMSDETRRTLLQEWQKRKQEEVTHAFLEEAAPLGLFPYIQALLMARWLRGDLDTYPPLFWR